MLVIFLILTFEMVGFTLAENAADEEMVNNETMDLETVVQNYLYTDDQAVAGTGFTNINNNFATFNPADMSPNLDLRLLAVDPELIATTPPSLFKTIVYRPVQENLRLTFRI